MVAAGKLQIAKKKKKGKKEKSLCDIHTILALYSGVPEYVHEDKGARAPNTYIARPYWVVRVP